MASETRTVHTHCRYCLAACGVIVTVEDNKVLKVAPDKENPYTWKDFCAKGRTAAEAVDHPRRIVAPLKRVGDRYVETTWDDAVTEIAARLNAIIDQHGADAVGCYWGNPAGTNAPNVPFLNALLDGIGTHQRYAVGSVDQNNFHVVAEAMYGSIFTTLVCDIDQCDFFLVVGGNPAISTQGWMDANPGGWRRMLERQKAGATIVVVDPIRTASAEHADLHLAVRPGQDWALLMGMVKIILDEGLEHKADTAALRDFGRVRALLAEARLDDLAARCDIPVETMQDLARRFAKSRSAQCMTRTGVAHHVTGTVGEWMGRLLVHITGNVDRPGGHCYERGFADTAKLANLTMKGEHVSRVAGRPMVAGTHALAELPDEISTPGDGQIRALFLNSGNPVVSGPDGAKLDRAMAELDLLVAVDLVQRESHRHADWLIPGTHWLERDELWAFSNQMLDKPYVQYARRAVDPPPGVDYEWKFWTDLALAMGKPMFGVRGLNSVIRGSRKAARVFRRPQLAFGPHWIDRIMVIVGRRLKWRDIMEHPHGWVYAEKEYGNFAKNLLTKDKKVHSAPPEFIARVRELLSTPVLRATAQFPYQLCSKRSRHSMNSWLNELPGLHPHGKTNDMEINPKDAANLGIADGNRARVWSPHGSIETTVRLSDAPRQGVVVMAHGWGSRIFDPRSGGEPQSFGANRNLLVGGEAVDPLAHTPALSSTWVAVERID